MITFRAKLGDGSSVKITSKTSWSELTFAELLEVEKAKKNLDPITLFSILTGTDYELLANSEDSKLEEALVDATDFIFNEPDWEGLKCPPKLYFNGEAYPIPEDLNKLKFGQRLLLSQLANEKGTLESFHQAVAIIMLPQIFGDYTKETEERLEEVKEWVLAADAIETFAAGQFFFLHSEILLNIGRAFLKKSPKLKTSTRGSESLPKKKGLKTSTI